MNRFKITIPASTANIGPGFDSVGMAMQRYLILDVVKQAKWEIKHASPCLPTEVAVADHFIYQVAAQVAQTYDHDLPSCKIIMTSNIPLARGLGSSASAVVAGIELANQLCDLALTDLERLTLATQIEGHPDNVAPSIFGGLIITSTSESGEVDYLQTTDLDLDIVLFIPDLELKTDDARRVIPTSFSREYAASASSMSNLMLAALLTKDYPLAGKMMEADLFHEPFRAKLIPNYDEIKRQAKQLGAYGTVISGAGPTMISFVPQGQGETIALKMQGVVPDCEVSAVKIDYNGLQVHKT